MMKRFEFPPDYGFPERVHDFSKIFILGLAEESPPLPDKSKAGSRPLGSASESALPVAQGEYEDRYKNEPEESPKWHFP